MSFLLPKISIKKSSVYTYTSYLHKNILPLFCQTLISQPKSQILFEKMIPKSICLYSLSYLSIENAWKFPKIPENPS